MRREAFYGPYRSRPIPMGERVCVARGHSQWVEALFHSDQRVHEMAQFMLDQQSEEQNRRITRRWWSLKIPPPVYTLQFIEADDPDCPRTRLYGPDPVWCPHCDNHVGMCRNPDGTPDTTRWTDAERDEWRADARRRDPAIQFAPSSENFAARFGAHSRRP